MASVRTPISSMLVVLALMLMILCQLFSVVIWLQTIMLHKGGLVLMLRSEESIPELEAAESYTGVMQLHSKNSGGNS